MVTDGDQIVVREQWDHPYKEGSSLFRFTFLLQTLCNLLYMEFNQATSRLFNQITSLLLRSQEALSWNAISVEERFTLQHVTEVLLVMTSYQSRRFISCIRTDPRQGTPAVVHLLAC